MGSLNLSPARRRSNAHKKTRFSGQRGPSPRDRGRDLRSPVNLCWYLHPLAGRSDGRAGGSPKSPVKLTPDVHTKKGLPSPKLTAGTDNLTSAAGGGRRGPCLASNSSWVGDPPEEWSWKAESDFTVTLPDLTNLFHFGRFGRLRRFFDAFQIRWFFLEKRSASERFNKV